MSQTRPSLNPEHRTPRTAHSGLKQFGTVIALLCWLGAARAGDNGLKKVTYLPHWVPQAQFAGPYVAAEKGFYARRGLDVAILRGGPDQPSSAGLAEGRADFASMFLATAIERRAAGVPVVNIAQIVRRSSLLLVAKKSSGIASPEQFDGKTIMVWPEFRFQPLALFRKFNVRPRVIPQRNTLSLFLRDGVQMVSAMWYNEYHILLNSGFDPDELTVFHYDAYGLNFPEDALCCLEPMLRNDPQTCKAFAQGTIEGWLYAFEHPEEALDIVMKRVREANMPTERTHHRWMLKIMKEIVLPDGDPSKIGELPEADYDRVARELQSNGLITNIPAFTAFYDNCARP